MTMQFGMLTHIDPVNCTAPANTLHLLFYSTEEIIGIYIGIAMLCKRPYIPPSRCFGLLMNDVGRNTDDKIVVCNPLYFYASHSLLVKVHRIHVCLSAYFHQTVGP